MKRRNYRVIPGIDAFTEARVKEGYQTSSAFGSQTLKNIIGDNVISRALARLQRRDSIVNFRKRDLLVKQYVMLRVYLCSKLPCIAKKGVLPLLGKRYRVL